MHTTHGSPTHHNFYMFWIGKTLTWSWATNVRTWHFFLLTIFYKNEKNHLSFFFFLNGIIGWTNAPRWQEPPCWNEAPGWWGDLSTPVPVCSLVRVCPHWWFVASKNYWKHLSRRLDIYRQQCLQICMLDNTLANQRILDETVHAISLLTRRPCRRVSAHTSPQHHLVHISPSSFTNVSSIVYCWTT